MRSAVRRADRVRVARQTESRVARYDVTEAKLHDVVLELRRDSGDQAPVSVARRDQRGQFTATELMPLAVVR